MGGAGLASGSSKNELFLVAQFRFAQRSGYNLAKRWPENSSRISMPVLNGANLIGGLLFGSIGFVAFIYGKRMHIWRPMFLGLALMTYPYFVENNITLFVIGAVGTATLFLFRN
jgi:hypothetical protein